MAGTRGLRKRAEVNYHEKQSNMVPAWLNKMNLDQTPPEPKRKKQAVKSAQLKDSPTTNKENESGSQRQPAMDASPARGTKKSNKPKKVKRTVVASRGRDQGMTVTAYGTCGVNEFGWLRHNAPMPVSRLFSHLIAQRIDTYAFLFHLTLVGLSLDFRAQSPRCRMNGGVIRVRPSGFRPPGLEPREACPGCHGPSSMTTGVSTRMGAIVVTGTMKSRSPSPPRLWRPRCTARMGRS